MPRYLLFILCLIAPLWLSAMTEQKDASSVDWFAGDEILDENLWNLLADPPRLDSIQQTNDMATLEWLQRSRTEEQEELALQYSHISLAAFEDIYAEELDAAERRELAEHFDHIFHDLAVVIYSAKDQFGRSRPYAVNLDLRPCVPLEDSSSYPSGHSTWGYFTAMLLADLFPDLKDELMARGELYGYLRVIGGVHYPTDVLAGQRLGQACAQKVFGDDAWKQWKAQSGYGENASQ